MSLDAAAASTLCAMTNLFVSGKSFGDCDPSSLAGRWESMARSKWGLGVVGERGESLVLIFLSGNNRVQMRLCT